MRRFGTISVILLLMAILMGYILSTHIGVESTKNKYQKIAPFSAQEMRFYDVSKMAWGDGLIFYRPVFPKLPLRLKVDHLQMQATPLEIKLNFSGVVADFAQTLLARDGVELTDTLKSFSPPFSFITQPLEALILLGQDSFRGSVSLYLRPYGQNVQLTIALKQRGKEILKLRTTVRRVSDFRLWGWTEGVIQIVNLSISDRKLKKAIANYYRETNRSLPDEFQKSLETNEPYQTFIHLPAPIQVSGLLKRF